MKLPECNDDRSTGPIMGSGNAPIEEKKRKEKKKTKKGGRRREIIGEMDENPMQRMTLIWGRTNWRIRSVWNPRKRFEKNKIK